MFLFLERKNKWGASFQKNSHLLEWVGGGGLGVVDGLDEVVVVEVVDVVVEVVVEVVDVDVDVDVVVQVVDVVEEANVVDIVVDFGFFVLFFFSLFFFFFVVVVDVEVLLLCCASFLFFFSLPYSLAKNKLERWSRGSNALAHSPEGRAGRKWASCVTQQQYFDVNHDD